VAERLGECGCVLHIGQYVDQVSERPPKHGLGNLAVRGVDHLAQVVKQRLRHIQRRPDLIAGFLAQTGMTLDPEGA
jgi:hypothetical protein